MSIERIDVFSEVKIKDTAQKQYYQGKKGVVMGISEDDELIYSYYVHIYGEEFSSHIDPADLVPTGKMFKRSDFYDGSSLGVTPDGEVTRVDIKGQESE